VSTHHISAATCARYGLRPRSSSPSACSGRALLAMAPCALASAAASTSAPAWWYRCPIGNQGAYGYKQLKSRAVAALCGMLAALLVTISVPAGSMARTTTRDRRPTRTAHLVASAATTTLRAGRLTGTVRVSNTGNARATASVGEVAVQRVGQKQIVAVGSLRLPALAPRRRIRVTFSFGLPASITPGRYSAEVCLSKRIKGCVRAGGVLITSSSPGSLPPFDVGAATFTTSLSCPSASFCAAVSMYGDAATFNGRAWSQPVKIDTQQLLSVSCPSASFCVAGDTSGRALTFDGASWSAPVAVSDNIASVSCPSRTFCAAVNSHGDAETFNGSGWSAPSFIGARLPPGSGGMSIVSISCPSASFC
jgi:hypothetical protein